MKKTIISTLCLLSVASCRQDTPTPEQQATDCKLATAVFDIVGTPTFSVIYNNNKITKMSSSNNTVNYEYSNETLSKKEYFYNSLPEYKYEYSSNNGLITEQKFFEYDGTAYVYKGKQTFTYTTGKLSRMDYFGIADEQEEYAEYVWTGDNITSIKVFNSNGNLDCTINYSYDLSKVNLFNTVFPNFAFQNVFVADWLDVRFISKNVMTQEVYCNGFIDNFTNTFTSADLYDKVVYGNGQNKYKFTYNCQ